ncbi:hypothetical protein [Micromonospora sp. CPCC 205556]|uniref:hypothetical protein n=1 Tax=Micromonospora sp. CPCC 205556 TaxID=3122398 RepID=UPI002FF277A4
MSVSMRDEELHELDELHRAATPGPWFVRQLDDDAAMSLVAVSTAPDTGRGERWPDFDSGEVVAATLVQHPRCVDVADGRWDENRVRRPASRLGQGVPAARPHLR